MKKLLRRSVAVTAIFSQFLSISTFALSNFDAAESLANEGIISKQNDAKGYQLQKPIIRQEAIAIVGKASGAISADDGSYSCKNQFSDVNEGWVCRSVELAANAGIVNKNNQRFRPKDKVSYFEAAVMALKSSCINPNHALKGGTDQERVIERAHEAGIEIDQKTQQKPITRGDFFRFVTIVRDFASSNSDQVDMTMPACTQFETYTLDDLRISIPSSWEKGELTDGDIGNMFDDPEGNVRVYIDEVSLQIPAGTYYDNTRQSYKSSNQGKILSEKPGPMAKSKMFASQWFDTEDKTMTRNDTYLIPTSDGKKMYSVQFAFNPTQAERYKNMMDSIFSSVKLKQTVAPKNTHGSTDAPKIGDVVLVHYKRTSDSGKVSDSGDTMFEVGKGEVFSQIEQIVQLMKPGESRTVRVLAKDAYGESYSEKTLTTAEFEKLKQQSTIGNVDTYNRMDLVGVGQATITKSSAEAIFGKLSVGKEIQDIQGKFKIISINGNDVTIELNNPNTIFYGKDLVVGATASTEAGDFTVQSISGDNIVLLYKVKYQIISQTTTEVKVRVKNIHYLAGENLNFEITLVQIEHASPTTGTGITL